MLVTIPADSKQTVVDPGSGSGGGGGFGWYRVLPSGDLRGPCEHLELRNGEGVFVLWTNPQTETARIVGPCY